MSSILLEVAVVLRQIWVILFEAVKVVIISEETIMIEMRETITMVKDNEEVVIITMTEKETEETKEDQIGRLIDSQGKLKLKTKKFC